MFTGLIEEIGIIRSIISLGGGKAFDIEGSKVIEDLKIDDSVAVNGACQTVVGVHQNRFKVEAIEETLRKSTFGYFRVGDRVNLERAARLGDRLGGHLVQGHIDCKGIVKSIDEKATEVQIWISFPIEFDRYIIPVGSIAVNGVSLTVARVERDQFMLTIIPHTWKVTNLYELKPGNYVNLEFDIIGKYVEKMVKPDQPKSSLEKYIDQPQW